MLLGKHSIHLWKLDLAALAEKRDCCWKLLTPVEHQRAGRYKVATPRETFVLVRGAFRAIASGYTGIAPVALPFVVAPTGKPGLDGSCAHIHFNVSHTQGLALIAFVLDVDVGVDVEATDPINDMLRLAQRYFSPTEYAQVLASPELCQRRAFYRIWTRKEAYIKGRSAGLGYPLDGFDVALEAQTSGSLLLADRHDPGALAHWSIQAIDVGETYEAALAVQVPTALPISWFSDKDIPW